MKYLLVAGDDKLGHKLIQQLQPSLEHEVTTILDQSSSLHRVIKLWRRGSLKFTTIVKIALANWLRPNYNLPPLTSITSNRELVALIKHHQPDRIILFRAGLIIKQSTIDTGVPLWNIHCMRLPDYGGLGQLHLALINRDLEQCATCHVVTSKIDEGEVIRTEAFELEPQSSYRHNEDLAYDAGIRLINKIIG